MIIRWLRTAARNRFEQLDCIAAENPTAAIRIDRQIERQVDMLLDHPLMGRDGRIAGTRELVISRLSLRFTGSRGEKLRFCAFCTARKTGLPPREGVRIKRGNLLAALLRSRILAFLRL